MRTESWLMNACGVDQAVIGDIAERRHAGRSTIWLWRQTLVAVAARLAFAIKSDPAVIGIVAVTVAVDAALPYLWTRFFTPYAVMLHLAWNPSSMNWWATRSSYALFQFVVFLHPWDWSGIALWCVLFGVMAWCLVGIWPERAILIVATFVLSNLCQTLPYLGGSFVDWIHDPFNPVWASKFLWYGLFTLLAIPLSIRAGGYWHRHEVRWRLT